jgi:hypothetical protein
MNFDIEIRNTTFAVAAMVDDKVVKNGIPKNKNKMLGMRFSNGLFQSSFYFACYLLLIT